MQVVLPSDLAEQITAHTKRVGVSVSEWFRRLATAEMVDGARREAPPTRSPETPHACGVSADGGPTKPKRRPVRPDPTRVIRDDGKDVSPGKRQVTPIPKPGKR